jgi:hypothetical protein
MKLPRRQFLHLAASAAALPAVSRIARAHRRAYSVATGTVIRPLDAHAPSRVYPLSPTASAPSNCSAAAALLADRRASFERTAPRARSRACPRRTRGGACRARDGGRHVMEVARVRITDAVRRAHSPASPHPLQEQRHDGLLDRRRQGDR